MKVNILKNIPVKIKEKSLLQKLGGVKNSRPSARLNKSLKKAVKEVYKRAKPKAMYRILPVKNKNGSVILDDRISIKSQKLSTVLAPCERAVVFLATLGEEVDRIIHKKMKKSPHYGYILDSAASLAVESTADYLQSYIKQELKGEEGTTLRYSPGYCDWPLRDQRKIFKVLPSQTLKVHLSDSFLMTPRKSISGVLGVCPEGSLKNLRNVCLSCSKKNCAYRRTP